jgi:hypothetical protein
MFSIFLNTIYIYENFKELKIVKYLNSLYRKMIPVRG